MYTIRKFSLVITTRCNLKCRLCCEYVPRNKPFPDMTLDEADAILSSAFNVFDKVEMLHLTGGGEPFLHPRLFELTETAMKYAGKFDRLMLMTNSTVAVPDKLLSLLKQHRDKIIVQVSHYGIDPRREKEISDSLLENGITCKLEKYYGENQPFGGWVDFGAWERYNRDPDALEETFKTCAVTCKMQGNWRTRDGKVHWCSRSQRGMELGLVPDNPDEYVDLLDKEMSRDAMRKKFARIAESRFLSSCDRCSGDQGTIDSGKRFPAAEQLP